MKLTIEIDESETYPYKMKVEITGSLSVSKAILISEDRDKHKATGKMVNEIEFMIKLLNDSIDKIKNL